MFSLSSKLGCLLLFGLIPNCLVYADQVPAASTTVLSKGYLHRLSTQMEMSMAFELGSFLQHQVAGKGDLIGEHDHVYNLYRFWKFISASLAEPLDSPLYVRVTIEPLSSDQFRVHIDGNSETFDYSEDSYMRQYVEQVRALFILHKNARQEHVPQLVYDNDVAHHGRDMTIYPIQVNDIVLMHRLDLLLGEHIREFGRTIALELNLEVLDATGVRSPSEVYIERCDEAEMFRCIKSAEDRIYYFEQNIDQSTQTGYVIIRHQGPIKYRWYY